MPGLRFDIVFEGSGYKRENIFTPVVKIMQAKAYGGFIVIVN
jgi:hypothetical protein